MKIAIAQLYTPNYDSWASIVTNNTKTYCDTHSYQFFHKRIQYPTDRHPAWYRIPFILDLFNKEDVDWVFWSDIDSLIMNHSICIEDFLKEDKDLIIASQGEGEYCGNECEHVLNTGQFFIKNTEWSRELLNLWWEWPEKNSKYLWDRWWDNEAMNFFWKNDILDFATKVEVEYFTRKFNSFCNKYLKGDFLCHFTGDISSEVRDGLIKKYIQKLA
tara:strand:+ start:3299 stop:3946 length:648 start_codon:yes stop_codon:yes gene_type:complete